MVGLGVVLTFQNCGGGFAPKIFNSEELASSGSLEPAKISARRLSRDEYDNSVFSLLKENSRPANMGALPEDSAEPFDNDPALQEASAPLVEGYEQLAITVADRFTADITRRNSILPCQPTKADDEVCMKRFVQSFTRKVFRRSVSTEEVQIYTDFALLQAKADNGFFSGLNAYLRVMLQHPEFIYRIEGRGASVGIHKLNGYEVATRLSFFLLGTTPDDSLLDAAEKGELDSPEGIRKIASTILSDTRAISRIDRFHALWLGYDKLPHPSTLTNAMRAETYALIKKVVFDENKSWYNVLTSKETFVDDGLATHYGFPAQGKTGSYWLSYGTSGRQGLLSHGSFLSVAGKFGDTSPTQRGKLIRTRLLCSPVGKAPPSVDVDSPPVSTTGRNCKFDRYESHRQGGSCFACHQMMDPIGFGLENYDQLGKFRTTDKDDTTCVIRGEGELVGVGTFKGPAELSNLLITSNVIENCLVEQLYHFSLGRKATYEERESIASLGQTFKNKDHRLKDLILDLVSANAFTYKVSE